MGCYKPLSAWQNEDGSITFGDNVKGGSPVNLPCGQCIGCRLARSQEWALRCVHEASLYDDNCFITLTYAPENLPPDAGLRKRDFQLFMKRLRKAYPDKKIRYYHAGEYGDRTNRPHYHAILFNHNFNDWTYLFDSPSGSEIYTSPTLERIWGLGFVTIGTVNMESAAYVARYCVKKITGLGKDEVDETTQLKPYERINDFTGEIIEVQAEYSTQSRRPGIGADWIRNYAGDVYPKDFTTVRGRRIKAPKYYDKYLESIDIDMYDDIKAARKLSMFELSEENSELRLKQKEKVKLAQYSQLKRSIS
jgi:hypothetical protein